MTPWLRAPLTVIVALGAGACGDRVEVVSPPEHRPEATGPSWYEDVTTEVGVDFVHFNGMTGTLWMPEMMGGGAAVLDYDGDGDLDLFFVQSGQTPWQAAAGPALFPPRLAGPSTHRLYRNESAAGLRAELRFVDVTEESGLARLESGYGMGVAVGDFDGDGWPDLYILEHGPNRLLRNRGDGTFEDVTISAGVADPAWSVAASFVDIDRDGHLDLFVANYVEERAEPDKLCYSPSGRRDYCGPLAYQAAPNSLFRNRGDGTFEDVSLRSGIRAARGASLGVIGADLDGNGTTDFYVANDQMANELWLGGGDGSFRNEAQLAGAAVNADGEPDASMGVDAADCTGDGLDDLVVAHLSGEATTLYVQGPAGFFQDESRSRALSVATWPYTSFGVVWLDFDLDGELDLAVANGLVTIPEEGAAAGRRYPLDQPNQLLRNVGGCRFEERSAQEPVFLVSEVSRGLVVADLDNNGWPDLIVVNNSGPARVWRHRGGDASWLGLRLIDRRGNEAVAARVRLASEGGVRWRRSRVDGSYASASDPRVVFALAQTPGPYELAVTWPTGDREVFRVSEPNRYHTLQQGSGEPVAKAAP